MAVALVRPIEELPAEQLDALFHDGYVDDIPVGFGRGTALAGTGTILGRFFAALVRLLFWQGKIFDPDSGTLRNSITPFGVDAIAAAVYEGASWVDGDPCIVLDYSETSRAARWVRDEIREVAPGRFVGVVFLRRRRLPLRFALAFD